MSFQKYLETGEIFPIKKFGSKRDLGNCVSFIGAPRHHPYDSEKIILICEPLSDEAVFYEFKLKDVRYFEELPNIGSEDGKNLKIARIYVLKGSLGVKYLPFEVNKPLDYVKMSKMQNRKSG